MGRKEDDGRALGVRERADPFAQLRRSAKGPNWIVAKNICNAATHIQLGLSWKGSKRGL